MKFGVNNNGEVIGFTSDAKEICLWQKTILEKKKVQWYNF